jgi:hypothetical protein
MRKEILSFEHLIVGDLAIIIDSKIEGEHI